MKNITWILFILILFDCSHKVNEKKIKLYTNEKIFSRITKVKTIYIDESEYIVGQFSTIFHSVGKSGLYMYDKKNRLYLNYDHNGRFLGVIGKKGHGPGEYNRPTSIFEDESGNKYIFASNKFSLIKYDDRNNFVTEYKFDKGFPFPGEFYKDNKVKILALNNFGTNGLYGGVEFFHILNDRFQITNSIKIDYPEIYEKYDLNNLTMPLWDSDGERIYAVFAADDKVYTYDIVNSNITVYVLNTKNYAHIDQKINRDWNKVKMIKVFSLYSISCFVKKFNDDYILYSYYNTTLPQDFKKLNSLRNKAYDFHIFSLKGYEIVIERNGEPHGAPIAMTSDGLLYTLLSDQPDKRKIGVYKIEINEN